MRRPPAGPARPAHRPWAPGGSAGDLAAGRGARLAAAGAVLLVAGCGGTPADRAAPSGTAAAPSGPAASAAAVPQLTPAQFAAAVAEPRRVTVNVHTPYEGEIAGTDLFLPFDRVQADASRLPADRSTPLAVYCRTGRMSAQAVATLRRLGYRDVVELAGGMVAWERAGQPLLNRPPG